MMNKAYMPDGRFNTPSEEPIIGGYRLAQPGGGPVQEMPVPNKDFFVTAKLQLLVSERDYIDAMIAVKDALTVIIQQSVYHSDPMNGAIIESVTEMTV